MGPGSSHGLTGYHSSMNVGLSDDAKSPTGMPTSSGQSRCVVCGDRTLPGRYACNAEHQKIAYGNRGFA
jgi:hypothetical protein